MYSKFQHTFGLWAQKKALLKTRSIYDLSLTWLTGLMCTLATCLTLYPQTVLDNGFVMNLELEVIQEIGYRYVLIKMFILLMVITSYQYTCGYLMNLEIL